MGIEELGAELVEALSFAFGMFREILWALILGFLISAAVQAVVEAGDAAAAARRLAALARDRLRPRRRLLVLSYAAVAIARSVFRKGADFTAAIAFEFASTNLVIELGIVMWLLLGWQFTLAEFGLQACYGKSPGNRGFFVSVHLPSADWCGHAGGIAGSAAKIDGFMICK